eukprot:SAG22_NODE_1845_length_3454_cov_1.560060_1_plen_169_part_00
MQGPVHRHGQGYTDMGYGMDITDTCHVTGYAGAAGVAEAASVSSKAEIGAVLREQQLADGGAPVVFVFSKQEEEKQQQEQPKQEQDHPLRLSTEAELVAQTTNVAQVRSHESPRYRSHESPRPGPSHSGVSPMLKSHSDVSPMLKPHASPVLRAKVPISLDLMEEENI